MITTTTLSWTQIGSIIGFIVLMFVLYRLLVEQKEATIQGLKENIEFLKDRLAEAKAQSPDILAQGLATRIKLFEDELKRLNEDKTSTTEQVEAKEAELNQARIDAESLSKKIVQAKELLKEFLCPYCDSPLDERSYHSESVECDDGHEFDVDHDYSKFQCGYTIVDGITAHPCQVETANRIKRIAGA